MAATFRLCKWCGERPVPPSCIRRREYACSRCRHQRPAGAAALARYNASAKRRAAQARSNAKRIYVGEAYHSMVRTAEDAQRINAVIKERRREFVTRQQNREEAEGPPTR